MRSGRWATSLGSTCWSSWRILAPPIERAANAGLFDPGDSRRPATGLGDRCGDCPDLSDLDIRPGADWEASWLRVLENRESDPRGARAMHRRARGRRPRPRLRLRDGSG